MYYFINIVDLPIFLVWPWGKYMCDNEVAMWDLKFTPDYHNKT